MVNVIKVSQHQLLCFPYSSERYNISFFTWKEQHEKYGLRDSWILNKVLIALSLVSPVSSCNLYLSLDCNFDFLLVIKALGPKKLGINRPTQPVQYRISNSNVGYQVHRASNSIKFVGGVWIVVLLVRDCWKYNYRFGLLIFYSPNFNSSTFLLIRLELQARMNFELLISLVLLPFITIESAS